MNGKRLRAVVPVAVLAMAVLLGQESLMAQESWQPARGGASTWGSGPPVRSTQAAGTGNFGEGANWSAGKGSFGSASQPGGVWTSGSGLPGPSKSASGPNAVVSPSSGATPKLAGVRLMLPASPTSAPKSNAQVYRARAGQKSATGSHIGMANGGRAGANKFSPAKSTRFSARSHASSGSRTGMSSGVGKPKESSSGLSPTGEPSSKSGPALGAPTGTEDPMR